MQRMFRRLPVFLMLAAAMGCGKKDDNACSNEVSVSPGAQARTKVELSVCMQNKDSLSGCFFSLEKIVRVDTGEDASAAFAVDFVSVAPLNCSCRAQVAISLVGTPPPGGYRAIVKLDYAYIWYIDYGTSTDTSEVEDSVSTNVCIAVSGTPESPTGAGENGSGGTDTAGGIAGESGTS